MRAARSFIASLILHKCESWEGLTDPVLPSYFLVMQIINQLPSKQFVCLSVLLAQSHLSLPTHCRCKGLLLHLITLSDTHTTPLDRGSARRSDYLTKHSQETDSQAPSGIRTTRSPSKRSNHVTDMEHGSSSEADGS
jgi:hypothetical protein